MLFLKFLKRFILFYLLSLVKDNSNYLLLYLWRNGDEFLTTSIVYVCPIVPALLEDNQNLLLFCKSRSDYLSFFSILMSSILISLTISLNASILVTLCCTSFILSVLFFNYGFHSFVPYYKWVELLTSIISWLKIRPN